MLPYGVMFAIIIYKAYGSGNNSVDFIIKDSSFKEITFIMHVAICVRRRINIVVYDNELKCVIDSVCFDICSEELIASR